MDIDTAKFDSALFRLANKDGLNRLAEQRVGIVRDIFEFWVEVAEERGAKLASLGPVWSRRPVASEELATSRADLQKFVRPRSFPRGSLKPRLLKLRRKWREADPSDEERLWKDLVFQFSKYGLSFADRSGSFFVYPYPDPDSLEFLSEPEAVPDESNLQSVVRDRVRAACLATIKDWGDGYNIGRGRPAETALHEWLVSMAAHFVDAGGQLKSPWASHDRTTKLHLSKFAEFLLPIYHLLPSECHVASDASFTQHIETAEERFRSRKWDDPNFVFCRKPRY